MFLSFDFTTSEKLELPTFIELYSEFDKKSIFKGIVTKIYQNTKEYYQYLGYDWGFYLEKNSTIRQFKNATISEAICQLCKEYQLNVGNIPNIKYTINKTYIRESLSDILFDLYKNAVDKGFKDTFYFDCTDGHVNLTQYRTNNNLKGYIANIFSIDSINNIESFAITRDAENLKNRVVVYCPVPPNKKKKKKGIQTQKQETSYSEKCTLSDLPNIEKYGLLSYAEEVDYDKKVNYKTVAKTKLNELLDVQDNISLNMIADYHMRKGVITTINNELLNLEGNYKIISSDHSIEGTKERVNVTVKKYEPD